MRDVTVGMAKGRGKETLTCEEARFGTPNEVVADRVLRAHPLEGETTL